MVTRLPFISQTRTEQVRVKKLLVGVVGLAMPVLDFHPLELRPNTPKAIAAQPPLLGYK
jgi:hypothetical protein